MSSADAQLRPDEARLAISVAELWHDSPWNLDGLRAGPEFIARPLRQRHKGRTRIDQPTRRLACKQRKGCTAGVRLHADHNELALRHALRLLPRAAAPAFVAAAG